MDTFPKLDLEPKGEPCKGLVFRCVVSMCITKHDGFLERRELRLLKRRSCKGCEKCGWIMEYMHEELYDGEPDTLLCGLDGGKMYTPTFESWKDWESTYYEMEFAGFELVEVGDGTE